MICGNWKWASLIRKYLYKTLNIETNSINNLYNNPIHNPIKIFNIKKTTNPYFIVIKLFGKFNDIF